MCGTGTILTKVFSPAQLGHENVGKLQGFITVV